MMRYKLFSALAGLCFMAALCGAGLDENKRAAVQAAWRAIEFKPYQAAPVQQLIAADIKRYDAIEAGQGAAADSTYFYAISNYVIGKYSRATGNLVARWKGLRGGPIGHINSCYSDQDRLYCANSNHPAVPMASSIEIFDTRSMYHAESKSLGLMDEGSLVWFDVYKGGWIAGFAHYDDETGEPFKGQAYAGVVLFDKAWRRTGGFALPPSILDRMAPQAASGGAIGPHGLLYIMGHDLPEMYVLQFPKMGPYLEHVATITVPAHGQAFAFDTNTPRKVWAIDRPTRQVVSFTLPDLN